MRKGWNTKSNLIGVFATFILLSYSKFLFQSFLLIGCETSYIFNGNFSSVSTTQYDPSESCKSGSHIAIAFFATLILCAFNIVPMMLLVLYPLKTFRKCLSKCKLDRIAITAFVEKYHSCYRDGLNGGRDMRSFAGLYFLIFLMATVLIAYVQPYKKTYMNIIDTILFATITVLTQLSTLDYFEAQATEVFVLALMPAIMLTLFCTFKLIVNKALKRMNISRHDLRWKLMAMLSYRYSKVKERMKTSIEARNLRNDSCKGVHVEMTTDMEETESLYVTTVSWKAPY